LLPLLLRRYEIADVMMLRPHILWSRARGDQQLDAVHRNHRAHHEARPDNQVSFSEIRIQDGVLNFEDAAVTCRSSSEISTCRWHGLRSRVLRRHRAI